METGAGNHRSRNTMRIRNLTRTGIILALGTERLYLEPTQKPAIVRWTQKQIGMRHIESGASYQCLQVPILEEVAHVEGIPDPEPHTLFLVDHHVFSRQRRTSIDWAEEVKHLLEEVYPDAERVTLVCDNLNTHKLTSLYKAFPVSEEALRLSSRLEIVYTPKHGSWLNIAEIELSVFSRQCLNRRIPDLETLRSEAEAWQVYRNKTANRVDWRFTTQDTRIKLKRLYPQTQP